MLSFGQVKWCNPDLEFGLNVWNQPLQPLPQGAVAVGGTGAYADWVKPITLPAPVGPDHVKEMSDLHKSRSCVT